MASLAPRAGFEPATLRLTAGCSAVELPRNAWDRAPHTGPGRALTGAIGGVTRSVNSSRLRPGATGCDQMRLAATGCGQVRPGAAGASFAPSTAPSTGHKAPSTAPG